MKQPDPFDDDDPIVLPMKKGTSNKRLIVSGVAAVVIVAVIGLKLYNRFDRERRHRSAQLADELMAKHVQDDLAKKRAALGQTLAPDPKPVLYELRVGDETVDVQGHKARLTNGTTYSVKPAGMWVWSGQGLSFDYEPALQVSVEKVADDVEVLVVSPQGQALRLLPTPSTMLKLVEKSMETNLLGLMKKVTASKPSVNIGEKTVEGQTFKITGAPVTKSLFACRLGPKNAVVVTIDGKSTPFLPLLKSVSAKMRPAKQTFELRQGLSPASIVELGKATKVGASQVELSRRKTVRRWFQGITFEHDPTLGAAVVPQGEIKRLSLTAGSVGVTFLHAPDTDPGELLRTMGNQPGVEKSEPITRTIGGAKRAGKVLHLRQLGSAVRTELYAISLGNRSLVIMLQYPPNGQTKAVELFDTIAKTMRPAKEQAAPR